MYGCLCVSDFLEHYSCVCDIGILCYTKLTMVSVFQSQHDELEAKFFEERAALEARYQKLYEPLYSKVLHLLLGEDRILEMAS